MQRLAYSPRPSWQRLVEAEGLSFHTNNGQVYWDESAAYVFSAAEINTLQQATVELENLCLQAVETIIERQWYKRLCIHPLAIPLIEASWKNAHKNLYGRFDIGYDGLNFPKLLEYNADTPTMLIEASLAQGQWLADIHPQAKQFNTLHQKLINAWSYFDASHQTVHFTCNSEHSEDLATVQYLQDTANQAGLNTVFIDIADIGWDGKEFVDLQDQPIKLLFKLYPWEWLNADEFASNIKLSSTQIIEPAWKTLLSNKGILAVLWELFPHHPNLLPTFFSPDKVESDVVRKPLYGRDGANIRIFSGNLTHATLGPYGDEGYIYQEYMPLPNFDGNIPVLGSWVIASQPAGLGIREDQNLITSDKARFIPHYIKD